MFRGTFGLVVFLMAFASPSEAQIIQAVNRFANAGDPEQQTNTAVQNKNDDKGILLLSQASAQAIGTDKAQIGLQAADFWLSRKTRFYARLTLPVKSEPAEESAKEEEGTAETEKKPSDAVVKQLVDPYGGILNLSGGLFTRLGKSGADTHQESQIRQALAPRADTTPRESTEKGEKAEEAALKKMQPDHGAFLDLRAGIKLIELPNAGDRAVAIGDSKLNVFYSGVAGLKVILPLYKRAVDSGNATKEDLAGGLTLGAYLVGNHAADPTQSDIFPTSLNRSTGAFTAVIGINLPGIAGLSFSMTPWTNDKRMGKVFVFGFDVLRPTTNESEQK